MVEFDYQDAIDRVGYELDLVDLQAEKLDNFLCDRDCSPGGLDYEVYIHCEDVRIMLLALTGRIRGFLSGGLELSK